MKFTAILKKLGVGKAILPHVEEQININIQGMKRGDNPTFIAMQLEFNGINTYRVIKKQGRVLIEDTRIQDVLFGNLDEAEKQHLLRFMRSEDEAIKNIEIIVSDYLNTHGPNTHFIAIKAGKKKPTFILCKTKVDNFTGIVHSFSLLDII